jgi:hypothetical protein
MIGLACLDQPAVLYWQYALEVGGGRHGELVYCQVGLLGLGLEGYSQELVTLC